MGSFKCISKLKKITAKRSNPIETNQPVFELMGDFKRDAYEGYPIGIAFDPATVLSHIAKEKWHAVSALSAIAALLAFFPRQEVELFAKKVSPKGFRDFIEYSM